MDNGVRQGSYKVLSIVIFNRLEVTDRKGVRVN